MTREEETAVIEQVKNGDKDAFEALVLAHQKKVYNMALRMVGNAADAADIAQEAFIRAYNAIGSFRGDCKFSVWLYRVTTNLCIDFMKQAKRRQAYSTAYVNDEDEEQEMEIPDLRFEPQSELERQELRRTVRDALLRLPEDSREILLLREIEGLSYEEIGSALSLSEGTVKSRIFRARKYLCRMLLSEGNISLSLPSIPAEEV